MSESENSNLDSFFKHRAQQANVEFNEDDWLHLEARLNNELPIKPATWPWLRKFWYAPIFLALIPTIWFALPESKSITDEVKNNSIELSSGQLAETDVPAETKSGNTILLEADTKNIAGKRTESESNSPINLDKANSEPGLNSETNKKLIQGNTHEKNTQDRININGDSEKGLLDNYDIGYVVLGNGNEALRLSRASYPHFLPPIAPGFDLKTNIIESLSFLDIEPSSKNQFRGYFTLGAGYGPDFSTVGMDNFIAPGARWKIDLGYAFSPRFQLLSGVIWVNNKYEAYGDEYEAPYRFWQNGDVADVTYGECKMIDIPLNLRYNVIASGRHRAFVTSGISTYFLTKEAYYFDYYEDYPDSPDYWGTDEMSVYPFSIINFSAGYEYMLTDRGSIQVEPFIKIPTGGVGWGNVDLNTLGIYFSYQYRIWP